MNSQADHNQADSSQTEGQVTHWLQSYRESVGAQADHCLALFERLQAGVLGLPEACNLLHELLTIMESLSPDPRTVSCAMLFVASEFGEDLTPIRADLPDDLEKQLEQLLYLIRLETEHLPTSTAHSAEGLRRLLLALIEDVRVVLIALAWKLVKLRQASKKLASSKKLVSSNGAENVTGGSAGSQSLAGSQPSEGSLGSESSSGPDSSPGSEGSPGSESSSGPDSSPGSEGSPGSESSQSDASEDKSAVEELAREVMLIHAPLANRLGVWQLKWELEDLAFRFDEPVEYHRIAKLVAERRADREVFINTFIQKLEQSVADAGIKGEVKGRPKHIYSIYKKMQRKGLDFHELFDVRAVRVLVEDVPACYSVLGLVHTLWQPIPGEFDDYITMPKGNNYQSLHTAVVGPEGKVVEVQIRTHEMNDHAELGVASHWRYKEGGPTDPAFDKKIAVMRQLLDSGDEKLDDESLLESFQSAASEDRIYVLTPKGQVIDLTLGATVLDFAYHIHTEVGHRCRGAKVHGRIVPLTYRLETGQRVEILTGKHPRPSRDWLNPHLGYIRGARARSKVRQWFRKENLEENLRQGKELVEADLKRLGLTAADLVDVPLRFNFNSPEDLYAAVGNGDLTVGQVVHAVERHKVKDVELTVEDLVTRAPKRRRKQQPKDGGEVTIEGVGNLMTNIARCCQPVPGDTIGGYITRGRGVSIHREDCPNVLRWKLEDNPRLIKVRWRDRQDSDYRVTLLIVAYNRRELIKDISSLLAASDVSVTDINSHVDENTEEVNIHLHVSVNDYEQLSDLLKGLNTVPNVFEARRLTHVS